MTARRTIRRFAITAGVLAVAVFALWPTVDGTDHATFGSLSGGTQPAVRTPARHAPCPTDEVLVSDGYAAGACHEARTLTADQQAAANAIDCPRELTLELVHVGRWVARCTR